MTTRHDLLTHWNEQLSVGEEADPSLATWRQRLRVRLYRFLLAMYGQAAWTGSPADAAEVDKHPAPLLVTDEAQLPDANELAESHTAGKAPRTRAEILRGLKNVRGLSEELAPPGPLQNGLPADAPVAVAACRKLPRANLLLSRLSNAGFAPVMERRGELFQIFVMASVAPMAIALLAQSEPVRRVAPAPEFRVKRSDVSANWFWAVACGLVGLMMTCYVISICGDFARDPRSYPFPAPDRFGVLMAATGTMDIMCLFFVWLTWREFSAVKYGNDPLSLRPEEPPPTSPRG